MGKAKGLLLELGLLWSKELLAGEGRPKPTPLSAVAGLWAVLLVVDEDDLILLWKCRWVKPTTQGAMGEHWRSSSATRIKLERLSPPSRSVVPGRDPPIRFLNFFAGVTGEGKGISKAPNPV